jgi:hypothetical protein
MKLTIRLKYCLLFIFPGLPFSSIAADLNPANANAQEQALQQERLRLLCQQQEIKPDVHDAGNQLNDLQQSWRFIAGAPQRRW